MGPEAHHIRRLAYQIVDVAFFDGQIQLSSLNFGEVQDIIDDIQQGFGRLVDNV